MKQKRIILGITPARGGSKGIPRKNLSLLAGVALIVHTIRHAQQSKFITDYVITTEDPQIKQVAISNGAAVIDRPAEMASDTAEVDPLLIATTNEWEKTHQTLVDIIVLLYPTAPLRDLNKMDEAIRLVAEGSYDSTLSLYEDAKYIWKRCGTTVQPVNYMPSKRMPRQKENWNQWIENKAVYVMKRALLFNTGCRLGGKIGFVEMNKLSSIDIDTPDDLAIARIILRHRNGIKSLDGI